MISILKFLFELFFFVRGVLEYVCMHACAFLFMSHRIRSKIFLFHNWLLVMWCVYQGVFGELGYAFGFHEEFTVPSALTRVTGCLKLVDKIAGLQIHGQAVTTYRKDYESTITSCIFCLLKKMSLYIVSWRLYSNFRRLSHSRLFCSPLGSNSSAVSGRWSHFLSAVRRVTQLSQADAGRWSTARMRGLICSSLIGCIKCHKFDDDDGLFFFYCSAW